jgi:hypothetical protein
MIANATNQSLVGMHVGAFDTAHLIEAAVGRDLDNNVADWVLALFVLPRRARSVARGRRRTREPNRRGRTAIPNPLLYLMILLAVLTLATSLFIDTHHDGLDVAVVVVLAVVVSAGLFTALVLQYPFSGSIAVSSEPFDSPPLAHLVQEYT